MVLPHIFLLFYQQKLFYLEVIIFVIYLLKVDYSDSIIREKIEHLNDKRIIVKWPVTKISKIFYQSILRYACLNEIKKQKGIDEINKSEIDMNH